MTDPHFAKKLASIQTLEELDGFVWGKNWGAGRGTAYDEAEKAAVALRRAEIARDGRG